MSQTSSQSKFRHVKHKSKLLSGNLLGITFPQAIVRVHHCAISQSLLSKGGAIKIHFPSRASPSNHIFQNVYNRDVPRQNRTNLIHEERTKHEDKIVPIQSHHH